jgi:pyruvate oxidase
MLTGLYDAKLDQSPVLAISGQVPSKVLGRGAFQDLDLTAIFGDAATRPSRQNAGRTTSGSCNVGRPAWTMS